MGRISDARSLITDAAARKKVYIDSSNFQAPHGDQKMWVRLYLNGKADHTTLAIEVCLDAPMRESFRGGAKFTIVDQSNAKPLVHLTQICIGSLEEVGNHFGSNAFADKNLLHVDPSRYIRDDKIILIVQLRADGDTHFANIFTNIRDALDEP